MQTADLLTLCTRVFAAICLLVFSIAYAVRGEWGAVAFYGLLSTLFWTLAARLYRKIHLERAQASQSSEKKP